VACFFHIARTERREVSLGDILGGLRGRFVHGEALPLTFDHNCGMVFLELFDGDKLRRDLGQELVAMFTSPE
jgi:hypothetical protein